MNRKICVVTGSRAEYGLLRPLLDELARDSHFSLQLIATGMHLSPEFGLTANAIEEDGFKIDRRIEMLLSADTPSGISKSVGLGMIGFADAFAELRPDWVILLGDRFEIFAAASAAFIARIPIAHLHGGETTEGAIDEAFRHSITKMSHLHFVAAEEYRRRVIQLGEHPDRVFTVGGLGVDAIHRAKLLGRAELEASLNFRFGPRNLLITFHPATLENTTAADQMRELLAALEPLENTHLIFTAPNADTDGRIILQLIEQFVATHQHARLYSSLGSVRYLSCLQFVDGVVGNSSSGLIEVPTFRKGTVNIGPRQQGRLKAESVIDCAAERKAIGNALARLYSAEFRAMLERVENPYGNGGAVNGIVSVLRTFEPAGQLKKAFFNVSF